MYSYITNESEHCDADGWLCGPQIGDKAPWLLHLLGSSTAERERERERRRKAVLCPSIFLDRITQILSYDQRNIFFTMFKKCWNNMKNIPLMKNIIEFTSSFFSYRQRIPTQCRNRFWIATFGLTSIFDLLLDLQMDTMLFVEVIQHLLLKINKS